MEALPELHTNVRICFETGPTVEKIKKTFREVTGPDRCFNRISKCHFLKGKKKIRFRFDPDCSGGDFLKIMGFEESAIHAEGEGFVPSFVSFPFVSTFPCVKVSS